MGGGIHPPLSVIASWPAPNYVNPVTRPPIMTAVAAILGPISIIMLCLRLWVRVHMQRSAGLDDWLMVAAVFPMLAMTIIDPMAVDVWGFNRHVWDTPPQDYPIQRKFVIANEILFSAASGLIKVSILLFYRRLSSRSVSSTFLWITHIAIACIVVYTVAFVLIPVLGCQPITAAWDQVDLKNQFNPNYHYRCFDEGADVMASGVISTVQDFVTALLPAALFWKLQIPMRQKVALYGIFAIGFITIAFASVRTYYTWVVFYQTHDVTWPGFHLFLWPLVEVHVGAMCANAPALKAFFKEYLEPVKRSIRSKSNSTPKGSASSGPSFMLHKLAKWSGSDRSTLWSNEKKSMGTSTIGEGDNNTRGGVQIQHDVHIAHDESSTEMLPIQFPDNFPDLELALPSPTRRSESILNQEIPTPNSALSASYAQVNHTPRSHDMLSSYPLSISPATGTGPSTHLKSGYVGFPIISRPESLRKGTAPLWKTWT